MFLKERQTNGDFLSKVSDMLWRGEALKFADSETSSSMQENLQQHDEVSALLTSISFSAIYILKK